VKKRKVQSLKYPAERDCRKLQQDSMFFVKMKKYFYMICIILAGLLHVPESYGRELLDTAVSDDGKPFSEAWEEVKDGFEYNIRALAFASCQQPADSSQNPDNDFLKLASYKFDFAFRPDFRLVYGVFDFSLKPRMTYEWAKIDKGTYKQESDEADEYFINEWLVRMQIHERLLVSYGRENLQWGPSFLSSPSNPFFKDNGRRSLKAEVPGSDFARIVWVPSAAWSVSLIAHTDNGEQEINSPFKETYVLKIDYTGGSAYGSIIGSHKRDDRNRLGIYTGWTASDALLLYVEGMLQQGSEALYPTTSANPFGASMEQSKKDDDDLQGMMVAGGSYTLAAGPTITLEYLYHSLGYDNNEADQYYELRQKAADAYFQSGLLAGLSRQTLSQTVDPNLRFLQQNYLMVQYVHSEFKYVLSLTGRWLWNMDDGSSRLYGSIVYSWGDHTELFALGTYNLGDGDTEFGTFLKYQWVIGLEYAF